MLYDHVLPSRPDSCELESYFRGLVGSPPFVLVFLSSSQISLVFLCRGQTLRLQPVPYDQHPPQGIAPAPALFLFVVFVLPSRVCFPDVRAVFAVNNVLRHRGPPIRRPPPLRV